MIRERNVLIGAVAQLGDRSAPSESRRSMSAIIKNYLKSLLALAAAAAATAVVMGIVIAILKFDLGAFLSSFN
jgi:hypothetical protein